MDIHSQTSLGTLYIVATPIGNLEDITLRALRILKEADIVFCEDTRVTRRLFNKYDIGTHLLSINAQTERGKTWNVMQILKEGKNVALVTDAGTPGISDPGEFVVKTVRKELPEVKIEAIPGPSAVTAALSISGTSFSEFTFLGFLPHKKGRQTLFKEIAASQRTVIFYESPHRILKALASLVEFLTPEHTVVIAREITKIYEEVVSGTAEEVLSYFETNKDKQRGEFVVIVSK